jgi:ribosomal protein S18 acetylase RimI-like enzyme
MVSVQGVTAIRACRREDHNEIVQLSLRAWAPVFASIGEVLGDELHTLLHGADWREHQARDVRAALEDDANRVWVAEDGRRVIGFVVARVADDARLLGEVHMVAVDPEAQRRGVGRSLTEHAAGWLRAQGMRVAVIGTGGDPGHAPARRLYEGLGYRLFPSAQYFRVLHPS